MRATWLYYICADEFYGENSYVIHRNDVQDRWICIDSSDDSNGYYHYNNRISS